MTDVVPAVFRDLFSAGGETAIFLAGGVLLVIVVFILGSLELGRLLEDMKIRRWLAKNDNFLRFKTWNDAKRGYRLAIREAEYERDTAFMRRRSEKRKAGVAGLRKGSSPARARLSSLASFAKDGWDMAAQKADAIAERVEEAWRRRHDKNARNEKKNS